MGKERPSANDIIETAALLILYDLSSFFISINNYTVL